MKQSLFLLLSLLLFSNLLCRDIKTTLDTTLTDTSKIFIGDRVFFDVAVKHSPNESVNLLTKVKSANFEILSYERSVIERDSICISDFKFNSVFFDTGKQTIPGLEFQIVEDNNVSSVFSDSLIINVKSTITDDTLELKDIKPPVNLHLKFLDLFLPIAVIIAIIIVIFLINRTKSKKPIFIPKRKKIIPAHIIALEKLNRLKAKELLLKGKIKRYYVEISWICREYLENRFKFKILESTTSEIRRCLKKYSIPQSTEFCNILVKCDMVKYAKFIPPLSDAEKIIDDLIYLIDKTKVIEENENTVS